MEEELTEDKVYQIDEIFAGVPEEDQPDVKTAKIKDSDFEDATLLEEIKENYEERKEERTELNDDDIPVTKSEDVRAKELSDKGKEIKKDFVSMINPKTVVTFADFLLSRGGSLAMIKTDKQDWRLDAEERQFLSDVLEVMMEEEGIEFWSAKVWLILALIFFYAMKTMSNYERYYSDNQIGTTPQMFIDQAKEKHAVQMAEIEVKKLELEVLRERANVEEKIRQTQDIITGKTTQNANGVNKIENVIKQEMTEIDRIELLEKYPPEKYRWIDGELKYKNDGTPRLRTGGDMKSDRKKTRQHPVTNVFMSEEDYKELVTSGDFDEHLTDAQIDEFIESPEVEVVEVEDA